MALYVYGKNAVMQTLKGSRRVEKALLMEGAPFPQVQPLLQQRRIPVERVSRRTLDQRCGSSHHQGIALLCEDYRT